MRGSFVPHGKMFTQLAVDGMTATGTCGTIGLTHIDFSRFTRKKTPNYTLFIDFWTAEDDQWWDSSQQDKTFKLEFKMITDPETWHGVKMELTGDNSSNLATRDVRQMPTEGMEVIGAGEMM